MSGGVKAGGIFFVVALVLTFGAFFVPLGCVLCAPIIALGVGAAAGYLALVWAPGGKLGQGILGGSLAGIGALVGFGAAFLISWQAIVSDPATLRSIAEQAIEQQPGSGLTADDLVALMPGIGIGIALCGGLLYLLFALGGGALGGWLRLRNRQQPPVAVA
jgi:hypothetical protein